MEAALAAPRARGSNGRPLKRLTPQFVAKLVELIERGVPQEAAAGSLGIPRRTFQAWLSKGREVDAVEPYLSLAEKLELALDAFHASRATIVGESGDERTTLEVLRRRFKNDWADPDRGGGSTVNVQVVIETERAASAQQMLEAAQRAFADQPELLERLLTELAAVGSAAPTGEIVDAEIVAESDAAALPV